MCFAREVISHAQTLLTWVMSYSRNVQMCICEYTCCRKQLRDASPNSTYRNAFVNMNHQNNNQRWYFQHDDYKTCLICTQYDVPCNFLLNHVVLNGLFDRDGSKTRCVCDCGSTEAFGTSIGVSHDRNQDSKCAYHILPCKSNIQQYLAWNITYYQRLAIVSVLWKTKRAVHCPPSLLVMDLA